MYFSFRMTIFEQYHCKIVSNQKIIKNYNDLKREKSMKQQRYDEKERETLLKALHKAHTISQSFVTSRLCFIQVDKFRISY